MPDVDLRGLSDAELIDHLWDLRLRMAGLAPQIQTRTHRLRNTIKIVRGTILAFGGFLALREDDTWLPFVLLLLGFWDLGETLSDDAAAANRGLAARRAMNGLLAERGDIVAELGRRGLA